MVNKNFGEYVRKLRTERNYSLKQLAEEIEITPYYLSYIESGRRQILIKGLLLECLLF